MGFLRPSAACAPPTPAFAQPLGSDIRIPGARRVVDPDDEELLTAALTSISEMLELTGQSSCLARDGAACADRQHLVLTWQRDSGAMTDRTDKPMLTYGRLYVLLRRTPPGPPLEPPVRYRLPAIARLWVQ